MSGAITKDMHVVIKPEYIGDIRPRPKAGQVYLVTAELTRNVKLDPLGGGRPFSIDPLVLQEATPEQLARAKAAAVNAPPRHRTGAAVHWNAPVTGRLADTMRSHGLALRHPLVVTKEHLDGAVDLIPLGGTDKGIRWTKIPAQHLTAIPMDRITVS